MYARTKSWLKHERMHGHEVRVKILTQRLIFELEYRRDQQLVLEEHNSERFFAPTLESCREKLTFLRVLSPSKRHVQWTETKVMPNVGASARVANRLSDKDSRFDYHKCTTSWMTMDYFVDMVSRGTPAELIDFVRDPASFIRNKINTMIVLMDQSALWLKLRGKERVAVL